MDVAIIGTGNVAHALAGLMTNSGHALLQVTGRNPKHLKKFSAAFGAPVAPIANLTRKADLYIVAISDDELYSIGDWLQLERKLVVHTAGSVSKDVLQKVSRNYGVLYPLQSLRMEMKAVAGIPFLVDGNTPDDMALIRDFALSLSDRVEAADDEERKKLHLAAVIVNNFTNHLYTLAEMFCEQEKLSFDLLHPLIRETANRIELVSPRAAQTGPATRGDVSTIEKQLELLNDYPQLKKVYQVMTESIRSTPNL